MRSAECGMGIHEMKGALLQEDLDSWLPLVDWLERRTLESTPGGAEMTQAHEFGRNGAEACST